MFHEQLILLQAWSEIKLERNEKETEIKRSIDKSSSSSICNRRGSNEGAVAA